MLYYSRNYHLKKEKKPHYIFKLTFHPNKSFSNVNEEAPDYKSEVNFQHKRTWVLVTLLPSSHLSHLF